MQNHPDISDKKLNDLEPFFPADFNPFRRTDFCVHQNTASCVLSCSKRFPLLKTTCPCRGQKTPSEVRVLYKLKRD